jgi:hypothetical protein
MEEKTVRWITLGIILLVFITHLQDIKTFFLAVFSPTEQVITPTLNTQNKRYEAYVTSSYYNYDTKNTYTYYFRLQGINYNILNESYCYLFTDDVRWIGAYGAYYTWTIRNMTLKAPLENGVCDFINKGILVNPDTSYYIYAEYNPSTGRTTETTYTCLQVSCFDKAKVEGQRISGMLTIPVKAIPPPQPPSNWLLQIFQAITSFFKRLFSLA